MSDSTIAYFGYGSLVNLGSLQTPFISAHRTTLKGWRRLWMARPEDPDNFARSSNLAFLSVTQDIDCEIDGMLITDHVSSLNSLDQRESLYSRTTLQSEHLSFHDDQPAVPEQFLYVADQYPTTGNIRILRSYLDVVMQGYHEHFGVTGVERFFSSTLNFDLDILEDREQPLYPRATTLSRQEKTLFANFR